MEATTNTLLDRLVLRTAQGENGIEPPAETPFEPSEQETFTDAPIPRHLAPVRMSDDPKLSAQTQNATPKQQIIAPPLAAIPALTSGRPSAQLKQPPPVKEATTIVPRIRTIREPYAVERVRDVAGPEKLTTTSSIEKVAHEESPLPAKMAEQRVTVEPDLVPDVFTSFVQADERRSDREITVNVTIGRLEIKRPGTEKQDSRKPKTREGNSLEQYLSKRRGGGA